MSDETSRPDEEEVEAHGPKPLGPKPLGPKPLGPKPL